MKFVYWQCLALTLGVMSAATASAAEGTARRIVVLDLKAEGGVREGLRSLLNEAMLARFAESDQLRVFGPSDIERMLDLEQTRQLMGCDDDGCFAEIGGALGADELVASSIGRIGSRYVLNLKLIDTRKAEVRARVSQAIGSNEDALYEGVADVVDELLDVAGVHAAPAPKQTWGWVSAGVAGGALIGTGVLLGLASSAADDARSANSNSAWRSSGDRSKAMQWSALGTTLVAVAGGALAWYFLSGDSTEPSPAAPLTVAPGVGESGLSISVTASW